MFYPIKPDDSVFADAEYIADRVHFQVLDKRIRPSAAILLTNGGTIIMGQSNPSMSMWIWTSAHVTDEDLAALKTALPRILSESEMPYFMARDSVADYLKDAFTKDAFAARSVISVEYLTAYKCENLTIPPKKGECALPTADDLPRLATFWMHFEEECFQRTSSEDDAKNTAQHFIDTKSTYILKDETGTVQALARFGEPEDGYSKIGPVFTARESRNKGYAAYITAKACEHIMSQNCTPILYADSENPASNKAYQNIGFTPAGTLKAYKFGSAK